ncbi:MAG TPA: hypothetical protein PLK30_04580 [Blastocatellia bacterium]|nr:hypothetical protein [Blastocatellia bacterium]
MAQSKELLDCAILSAQRALEDFEFIQPVQPHQCRESSHGSGQTDSPPRKTLGRLYQSAEKKYGVAIELDLDCLCRWQFRFCYSRRRPVHWPAPGERLAASRGTDPKSTGAIFDLTDLSGKSRHQVSPVTKIFRMAERE